MRITQKDVEAVANRINDITGNPKEYSTRVDGKFKSNIGNYHISYAYGGANLHQVSNESGGVRSIFGGHMPKRELYDRMQAYCDGLIDAKL
jgi:hypothetical protein